jgi:hypothetical protein
MVNLDKQVIIGHNTDIKRPYYGFPVSHNGHLSAIETRSQNFVPFKGFVQRKGYEMSDDWKQAWQPLIDAVGTDFGSDVEVWGADEVERSSTRRFLEPLEFDCPLHYDGATVEKYGYSDIVAPYSSILTYTLPAMWQPGQHIWTSAERNAQPARSPVAVSSSDPMQKLMPSSSGFFATDIEIDYLQPVVVGDHMRMQGRKLLSCIPKETRVGRGAFITWESEILNQRAELVARIRVGVYQYVPHPSKGE